MWLFDQISHDWSPAVQNSIIFCFFFLKTCNFGHKSCRSLAPSKSEMVSSLKSSGDVFYFRSDDWWTNEWPCPCPVGHRCSANGLFSDHEKVFEVPHTASVKLCHNCRGIGMNRCWRCCGRGRVSHMVVMWFSHYHACIEGWIVTVLPASWLLLLAHDHCYQDPEWTHVPCFSDCFSTSSTFRFTIDQWEHRNITSLCMGHTTVEVMSFLITAW